MTDEIIEEEIKGKGKIAPRVTMDIIEGVISSETYFTAANGLVGANYEATRPGVNPIDGVQGMDDFQSLKLLTFCVLVLKNGFTVTGESACASPDNFDAEIGMKIARENAIDKIWMLEGYLLKQKLSGL